MFFFFFSHMKMEGVQIAASGSLDGLRGRYFGILFPHFWLTSGDDQHFFSFVEVTSVSSILTLPFCLFSVGDLFPS